LTITSAVGGAAGNAGKAKGWCLSTASASASAAALT